MISACPAAIDGPPPVPKATTENLELLTSHFGFVPSEFVDDVINSINLCLYTALSKMLAGDELNDEQRSQIETLFEHSIDKHFDKFELYCLKNVFTIPEGAKLHLPNYADYVQQEGGQLDEIREKIMAERYYQYCLAKEIKKTESKIRRMNLLKAQLVEKAGPIMAKSSAVAEKIVKLRSTLVSAKHETRDGKFVEVLADADERLLLDSNVVAMTSGAGRIDLTKYAKDYSRSFKLGDLEKHSKIFTSLPKTNEEVIESTKPVDTVELKP